LKKNPRISAKDILRFWKILVNIYNKRGVINENPLIIQGKNI
jgi:hypothetical protein